MYHTNQSTINGKFTIQQQTKKRTEIWKWILKKTKIKKNGDQSKKGIQISYGQVSRKFKISYNQARYIFNFFTQQKYLRKWCPPIQNNDFKTKGNYYSIIYFG